MANVNDNPTTALCTCLEELISLKKNSNSNYFAWMPGGTFYSAENLEYQKKTLLDLKTIKESEGVEGNLDVYTDANNFMRTINAVPSSNVLDSSFISSGKMLWDVYKSVLANATFPNQRKITEEEKQQIQKLNAEYEKLSPAYNQYQEVYDNALEAYNDLRLKAMSDPIVARKFTLNGKSYKQKVDKAMKDWVSLGHKETIEKINNDTLNIHRETSESWINELLERMSENAIDELSGPYHTYLGIKDIFDETLEWTEFTIDSSSLEKINSQSKRRFTENKESTSGMWFWKSRSTQSSHGVNVEEMQSDKLAVSNISFKLLQVPIQRPWFDPTLIECGAWKWNNPDMAPLSTGGVNPTGQMIAYPTTAIFVKDLNVEIDNVAVLDKVVDSTSTTQTNTVGPFRLFRKRETSSRTETNEYHMELSQKDKNAGTLVNSGVQLIGFRCYQLPKTPSL